MEEFVRNRITQLRLNKGISEYQLSYDLGHSRGYINNISSGKSLPSMSEFFAICEYFNITPIEFFDTNHTNPELLSKAIDEIQTLNDDDMLLMRHLLSVLKNKFRKYLSPSPFPFSYVPHNKHKQTERGVLMKREIEFLIMLLLQSLEK